MFESIRATQAGNGEKKQLRQLLDRGRSHASADGDGVQIQRLTGFSGPHALDPFLMLDELKSEQAVDYIGGFPPHPHRGFETITYLKAGKLRHSDHLGNSGLITDGGAQWMVAGHGVIHSEMPEQTEGLLHGFQLWLNLPAKEKMMPPSYKDLTASQIGHSLYQEVDIHLLAGTLSLDGKRLIGPIQRDSTRPLLADLEWETAGALELETDPEIQLYLYVYQGALEIAGANLCAGALGFLGPGDHLSIKAGPRSSALLFGGLAIGEPVSHYGPFVMNTQAEIDEAVAAYNEERLTER